MRVGIYELIREGVTAVAIEIGGPYEVGGLRFEKTEQPKWPYRLLGKHNHSWRRRPRKWSGETTAITAAGGAKVARLGEDGVTLLVGYAWNGSTGVPDTMACMRASALHDAWCQAMRMRVYGNGFRNWRRGAAEYRCICRADGMGRVKARLRWLGLLVLGLKKLLPG